MCDYSLELYRSRPAVEEEEYTLHRFPSGTMGFTSARDCETAVCMPADARLQIAGIAEAVQRIYAVGPVEEVVMTRMEGGTHVHRDAVRFSNGREILLQSMNAGLTATLIAADYTDQVSKIAKIVDTVPIEHTVVERALEPAGDD